MANPTNFHNDSFIANVGYSEHYTDWVIQQNTKREVRYQFWTHYHPYTDELIETLNRDGLPAMLDAKYHEELTEELTNWYKPESYAVSPFPKEVIDVSDDGPYAIYN